MGVGVGGRMREKEGLQTKKQENLNLLKPLFSTGVPQEFFKMQYLTIHSGAQPLSFRLSNKKIITASTTITVSCE